MMMLRAIAKKSNGLLTLRCLSTQAPPETEAPKAPAQPPRKGPFGKAPAKAPQRQEASRPAQASSGMFQKRPSPQAAGEPEENVIEQQLEAILRKYSKIEGEWSAKDIENFADELTGAKSYLQEAKTQEAVNHAAIASLRTGQSHAHVDTVFQGAAASLEQLKPTEEDLHWRRDKFDASFAKYIHKYLSGLQKKPLPEQAYKDLHFMTTKYVELIGSVEFNAYLQGVLSTTLNLAAHGPFQALLVDLLVHSIDFQTAGRVRALALEKFLFLTLHLENPSFYKRFDDVKKLYLRDLETHLQVGPAVAARLLEDEQFMLHFQLVSLAKNHNFFSQVDTYMKEFARLSLGIS